MRIRSTEHDFSNTSTVGMGVYIDTHLQDMTPLHEDPPQVALQGPRGPLAVSPPRPAARSLFPSHPPSELICVRCRRLPPCNHQQSSVRTSVRVFFNSAEKLLNSPVPQIRNWDRTRGPQNTHSLFTHISGMKSLVETN